MSRYCDLTQLRAYLSPNGALGTGDDGLLQDCIERAEEAIDNYTRRTFTATAGTAYFNRFQQEQVRGPALYLERDLYSLVGVTNGDGATIPVGSVWLEPRNDGPPYRMLRLKSSYVWQWNTDSDLIISGSWGYSGTAPADIAQATLRYATFLYRQKDVSPSDQSGFPNGGEQPIPRGMPDDVRYILSPYRSRTGGAV